MTEARVSGQLVGQWTYDDAGRLLEVISPSGVTRSQVESYTAFGAMERMSDADGYVAELEFDALGQGTAIVGAVASNDPSRVQFSYDDLGRMETFTSATGVSATATYDAMGRQTAVTDSEGNSQSWVYDDRGLVTEAVDKGGRSTVNVYDDANRIREVTTRTGDVIVFTYDTVGRLTRVDGGDAFVAYTYDALSRVVSVENEHQLLTFAYDTLGRLSESTSGPVVFGEHPDLSFGYTYSAGGRVEQVDGPVGPTTFDYDARGRPIGLTDPKIGTTTYAWDADDRLSRVERDSGLATEYAYTLNNRLARTTTTDGGGVIQDDVVEWDLRGQIGAVTDGLGRHEYSYDVHGQLTGVDHPSGGGIPDEAYSYDDGGNRTEWTGHPPADVSYDIEGRLLSDADFTYTYDDAGQLTSKTDIGSAHVTEYHWNAFGELVRMVHPDGTESTFAYDGLGRRVEVVDKGAVTRFGWEGGELRMEFDGSNQLTTWFGTGLFAEPLADWDAATGQLEETLRNQLDSASGSWTALGGVTYDARDSFGNPAGGVSGAFEHHALTWHTQDPSGLIYARARYLDPTTGRFISEDPIPSTNLYGYAGNNPVSQWDPLGLSSAEYSTLQKKESATVAAKKELAEEIACTLMENAAAVVLLHPPGASIVVEVACRAMGSRGGGKGGKGGGGGGGGGTCPIFSFEAGTPIQAVDGVVAIEEIRGGNRVRTVDPDASLTSEARVDGRRDDGPSPKGLQAYNARNGWWSAVGRAPTEAGAEYLQDGELWRVGPKGAVSLGAVSREALQAADATWSDESDWRTPHGGDLVLVLEDGGGVRHAWLSDLEVGAEVAFQGRVLEVGDGVVTPTGVVLGRVVQDFSRTADVLLDVELAWPDGSMTTVSATPEHPFWVGGEWVALWRLEAGDALTTEDGEEVVLLGVERREGAFEVFNFEVEGERSYLVGDGGAVRAHNAKKNCTCFVAGTLVVTPTRDVAIEDAERGDLVLAADGSSSEWDIVSEVPAAASTDGGDRARTKAKDGLRSKAGAWARRAVAAGCVAGACQAMAFDATTGMWEDSAFSVAVDAEELLGPDGHLYRVTDDGLVDRGVVDDFEELVAADVAIDEAWDDGAPEWDDWVLVLGDEEEAGHHRLLDVAAGERFAWQGRVFETRVGSAGHWEVRDSGQVLARVTETFKRMAVDEVIDLEIVYPDGSVDVLTGTHEHPFWVEAEQDWVKLGELAEGDVLTTDGGGEAVVVGLTVKPGATEVFNIEVAGPHNYFVRADGSDAPGVLVHNKSGVYIHVYDDGCVYVGKGRKGRSRRSKRQRARQLPDGTRGPAPVRSAASSFWIPASDDEAFLIEAAWMRRLGWDSDPGSRNHGRCFLNKINSPGFKLWANGG